MLRIGLRAHDLGSFSCADALGEAAQNAKEGAFIQLALKKAIPSSRPWQEWDEEYISSIVSALSRHGVSVAMIGCYINPIEPDEEKRRLELDRFRKSLSLAKAFGCPYVGTETGTLNPKGGYSPDTSDPRNLAVFRDSLSQMVDAAERYGSYVAIEAVARVHTISTPERLASILDGFRSDHLKVILDPVNLIPWTGIPEKDGVPLIRDIEPHTLVFHEMRWSIKGFCRLRKGVRTFHIARIRSAIVLDEMFKPSPAIIDSVTPDQFLDYERVKDVTIRLNEAGRQFASVYALNSAQTFTRDDDGFFTMCVPSVPLERLVPWILRQAGDAEPLGPPAAVEAVNTVAPERVSPASAARKLFFDTFKSPFEADRRSVRGYMSGWFSSSETRLRLSPVPMVLCGIGPTSTRQTERLYWRLR